VFEPAHENWTDGEGRTDPSAQSKARELEEGRLIDSRIDPKILDPTDKDRRTGKYIGNLEGTPAFECNIRFFVFDQRAKPLSDMRRVSRTYSLRFTRMHDSTNSLLPLGSMVKKRKNTSSMQHSENSTPTVRS